MKNLKQYKKQGIVLLILCLAALTAGIILYHNHQAQEEESTVTYEDVDVTTTTIQQTLTAAGEVDTVKEETILFSKTKTFKGMCVEAKESVPKGGHIALYSDGTYLCADHSGVVSAVNAPPTGSKGNGTYAVTFLPDDQIAINLTVPEDEISRIDLGNQAKVVINAEPDNAYSGTITYVSGSSNAAISGQTDTAKSDDTTTDSADTSKTTDTSTTEDTTTDTSTTEDTTTDTSATEDTTGAGADSGAYYKAVVTMDNDGSLKIGMSASCTILLAEKQDVLAVPVNAVHITSDYRYVNVIGEDGSVTKTKVETGISNATYVEIVSGLTGTEKVRVETMK